LEMAVDMRDFLGKVVKYVARSRQVDVIDCWKHCLFYFNKREWERRPASSYIDIGKAYLVSLRDS
jgi:hypothetical protein